MLCWPQFSPRTRAACWPVRCVGSRRSCGSAAPTGVTCSACTHCEPSRSPLSGRCSVSPWVWFRARRCLSADALASASPVSLLASALLGAGAGFLATGVALYAAGRRAINRQISDERAQLASRKPLWRLLGIDFLILAAVVAVEWYQRRHGGFEGVPRIGVLRPRSVPAAASGDRSDRDLAWRGPGAGQGRRASVRAPAAARRHRFGRPLRGLLTRSIRRRSWAAASAVIMVGLIVALGTSVASFSASYNQAKARDARFVVGSDVRVTPAPISALDHPPQYAEQLEVPGIQTATPVVYGLLTMRYWKARTTRTRATWPRSIRPRSGRSLRSLIRISSVRPRPMQWTPCSASPAGCS